MFDVFSASLTSTDILNENTIIYGRMPKSENEIVLDKMVLNRLLASSFYNAKFAGLNDLQDFVGRKASIYTPYTEAPSIKMDDFEVVGICNAGAPSVYMSEKVFVNVLTNSLQSDPHGGLILTDNGEENNYLSHKIYDVNLAKSKIELTKGKMPQKDYEIIVVNDGSPENMTEFLAQYSNKIKYIKKENGGPSTARNAGIEIATGKYIAFLDSDDRWLPKKLKTQLEYMKKNDVIWSYCGYRTFGGGESVEYKMTDSDIPIVHRYNTPYIATPCVMIERQYLVDCPNVRFNPDLRYGQDSYFWLMINADNPILAIPDVLVEVRIRGGNASKRARVQIQARSNVWKCRKDNKKQLT